jgi:pimeloyl-ACP methyl ester carboxylesterase
MVATSRLRSCWVAGAGVRLHAVTAGDPAGPPVVLLHGFPDFWYGWRHQIGALAAAGFRVIALDQRGYNRSDKPPRVADYATARLAADVAACLDGLGLPRAAVVGHDWGGGVAWCLAGAAPERVSRLVVINCPHPYAMQAALEGSWGQIARSWYVFAAQVPRLPEWVAAATGYRVLTRALRSSARPGAFTPRDLARYRRAWRRPGAMTGMVNWYRAAARHPVHAEGLRVRVPALLLWGRRDPFLGRGLAPASAALCDDVRVVCFPNSGHWPHREEPEAVNRMLLGFLSQPEAGRRRAK